MIYAFVGKGGVGKTTISSAFASNLAESGKTAIVSTDFMSSLKYVFPESPRNLDVVELKERDVAERWKERYGAEVSTVLRQFVDVDDWIIDHIATSPGVAEEFMIANLVDMSLSGEYENIVWDSAASSSTMHLLYLEREFYEHLDRDVRIFLRLRDRFRSNRILQLLEQWKGLANRVWSEIMKSEFFLVTTSDELSLVQAEEIEADLRSMDIHLAGKICNRCSETVKGDYLVRVPEFEGTAIGIVDRIRGELPEKMTRN